MQTQLTELLKVKASGIIFSSPADTVSSCIDKMLENQIGSLPIMIKDQIVGIFCESDVIEKVLKTNLNINEEKISSIMTHQVICISKYATVGEAMRIINEKNIRHLPVIEAGKITGIISISDLTKWLSQKCDYQESEINALIQYVQGDSAA